MTGAWLALDAGGSVGLVAGAAVFTVAVVLLVLEPLMPFSPQWRPGLRVFALDLTHALVVAYAVAPAIRASLFVVLASAGASLVHANGAPLWPTGLPLAVQLVLAVVLADLGAYLAHRFMHVSHFGWRLHAVHHSPEKLHVLASARTHPFNAVLTLTCETGPLILLGITPEVLALWTIAKGVNGMLQHSNVDLRPGRLGEVLATTDVHRWHHSRVLAESNTNFGNTTMIWDHVFGTYFRPADRLPSTDVGIAGAVVPERYLAHLVTPFVLGRLEREAQARGDG